MRVPWLADVLEAAGVDVIELDGWKGRGRDLLRVDAVIEHATITGTTVPDANVARLLRDGYAGLPGPLSQCGLDRQGRWWLIADGVCSHNGYGEYGNQTIGVEAFLADGEHPNQTQLESWQRGTAAICNRLNLPTGRVLAHKETDPKRKSDPRNVDMPAFRVAVQWYRTPKPERDDLLMAAALNDDDARRCLIRQWFIEYLGGTELLSASIQDRWLNHFREKGADLTLAALYDSNEAKAYRARTPDRR